MWKKQPQPCKKITVRDWPLKTFDNFKYLGEMLTISCDPTNGVTAASGLQLSLSVVCKCGCFIPDTSHWPLRYLFTRSFTFQFYHTVVKIGSHTGGTWGVLSSFKDAAYKKSLDWSGGPELPTFWREEEHNLVLRHLRWMGHTVQIIYHRLPT